MRNIGIVAIALALVACGEKGPSEAELAEIAAQEELTKQNANIATCNKSVADMLPEHEIYMKRRFKDKVENWENEEAALETKWLVTKDLCFNLDDETFMKMGTKILMDSLRDPDSAEIKDVRVIRGEIRPGSRNMSGKDKAMDPYIRGMVNANNAYGGKTGFKEFDVYLYRGQGWTPFTN